MLGGIVGEFSVSYNASFEQDLQPYANYVFIMNTQNIFLEISRINRTDTRPSCNYSKFLYLYVSRLVFFYNLRTRIAHPLLKLKHSVLLVAMYNWLLINDFYCKPNSQYGITLLFFGSNS